jgi:ribosome biogenesis GTP-binding protein YsxC/EngB
MITKRFPPPPFHRSFLTKPHRGIILNKTNRIFNQLPKWTHMSGSTDLHLPTPTRNLILKSKVSLEGEFSHLTLPAYLDYWRDFHQRPTKSNSQYKDEFLIRRKEFLMAGHSNVGKSSLLNSIFNTDAAHVSKTPGKTRNLFFYKLAKDPDFILVDAPGYGYAVGSRKEIDNWAKAMNIYLKRSQFVHRVLVLVDGSRGVSNLDEILITMLDNLGIPFFLMILRYTVFVVSDQM